MNTAIINLFKTHCAFCSCRIIDSSSRDIFLYSVATGGTYSPNGGIYAKSCQECVTIIKDSKCKYWSHALKHSVLKELFEFEGCYVAI